MIRLERLGRSRLRHDDRHSRDRWGGAGQGKAEVARMEWNEGGTSRDRGMQGRAVLQ